MLHGLSTSERQERTSGRKNVRREEKRQKRGRPRGGGGGRRGARIGPRRSWTYRLGARSDGDEVAGGGTGVVSVVPPPWVRPGMSGAVVGGDAEGVRRSLGFSPTFP